MNAAQWATSAGNKFREVSRTTENPTKALAEGLTSLAEATRALDNSVDELEKRLPPG